jgi:hypothetical protein
MDFTWRTVFDALVTACCAASSQLTLDSERSSITLTTDIAIDLSNTNVDVGAPAHSDLAHPNGRPFTLESSNRDDSDHQKKTW